jgi:Zn-finger nucleic acid-binding protein
MTIDEAQLICPKCHGELRTYERNGVTIDQCGDCRGVFLDRDALQRLIDSERDEYREQMRGHAEELPRFGGGTRGHGGQRRRRPRGSFLSDLFD